MLDYQRQFYQDAKNEVASGSLKGYVFGDNSDPHREIALLQLLQRHSIEVYELGSDIGQFNSGEGYIVPLNQPQSRLIRAMFRTQKSFTDSLFYDVSTWTLPMAFNLPYRELSGKDFKSSMLGEKVPANISIPEGKIIGETNVGYVFPWDRYFTPKALYALQRRGIRAKVASAPFTGLIDGKPMNFGYGTVIVPAGTQDMSISNLKKLVEKVAKESGVDFYGMDTGLTQMGIDLGSPSFSNLRKPKIAVLAGPGTSSYDVGEVWHLLDQRYGVPASIIDQKDLYASSLDRYNTIVMVNGNYGNLPAGTQKRLKEWLRDGGVIVAMKGGARWVSNQGLSKVKWKKNAPRDSTVYRPYAKLRPDLGSKRLGGSIFQAELDVTHPLCYWYKRSLLPIFRRGTAFADKSSNPYATPLRYTAEPVLSGYIADETLEQAKGSAAAVISAYGQGRVISLLDNPNFRAFWWGTNKLFANAVFFGHTISCLLYTSPSPRDRTRSRMPSSA